MSSEILDVRVRAGCRERDHDLLCRIAATSRYTKSFSAMMFSGAAAYEKGWIRVATDPEDSRVYGFTCVRHRVRSGSTVLYFLGVQPEYKRRGVGTALMNVLETTTPYKTIELYVEETNHNALGFYAGLDYTYVGRKEGSRHMMLLRKVLP